jgi:hypothetical protein
VSREQLVVELAEDERAELVRELVFSLPEDFDDFDSEIAQVRFLLRPRESCPFRGKRRLFRVNRHEP